MTFNPTIEREKEAHLVAAVPIGAASAGWLVTRMTMVDATPADPGRHVSDSVIRLICPF
jgi:hypothetical protein